jgi:excinuclease ABC subunit A
MDYKTIKGLENIDKVIEIDQSHPLAEHPRSNPPLIVVFLQKSRTLCLCSYLKQKSRGYNAGRFSFNVKGGRCDMCEGGGMRTIEMNFLPDVYVHCESAMERGTIRETLEIRYKGKSISDVLNMTVDEACDFFQPSAFYFSKDQSVARRWIGIYYFRSISCNPQWWRSSACETLAQSLGKKIPVKHFIF